MAATIYPASSGTPALEAPALEAPKKRSPARSAFCCFRTTCRAALEPRGAGEQLALVCGACGEAYPVLGGELPVLAPQPSRHLAAEAIRLRRDLSWFQQQRGLLAAGERRFPRRAPTQERIRAALERTSDCFVEILAMLVSHLDRAAVVEVAAQPPAGLMSLGGWLLGALLGMRHALEPDHLVAVCTMVGPGDRLARRGAALGALWGLGHTVALLLVTGVLGALHARLPPGVARLFELGVSVMLVALGIRAVRRAFRDRRPMDFGSPHPPHGGLGWRPFAVGVVHGLAGSGALAVLTIAALPSTSQRLLYTCVFGAGSVLGMSLLSTAATLPLSRGQRRQCIVSALAGIAGILSTVGGLAWAIEIVSSFPN